MIAEYKRCILTQIILAVTLLPGVADASAPPSDDMKAKFEQYLSQVKEVQWNEQTERIYSGPKELGYFTYLFPDNSMLVYAVREQKGGRRKTLSFYDLISKKTSHVDVLTAPEDKFLTIYSYLISPDSKKLWLFIGIHKAHGYERWFPYDIKTKAFDRESEKFKYLQKYSHSNPSGIRRPLPGPAWSAVGHKFYEDQRKAHRAGVKRFWSTIKITSRCSEVFCDGTPFEIVTGRYKKGHIFVKGRYITSLQVASPWVPQDCWFIRAGNDAVVYKFYGYGEQGCWKSRLNNRSILRMWDIPGVGVVVTSMDDKNSYADLIPSELPKKNQGRIG
ncbi:MAG: hypothetical protein SVT52_01505 [Planctomycetota bacterium]|nr:hypothetical protein [Planctomycetota bacterium]